MRGRRGRPTERAAHVERGGGGGEDGDGDAADGTEGAADCVGAECGEGGEGDGGELGKSRRQAWACLPVPSGGKCARYFGVTSPT